MGLQWTQTIYLRFIKIDFYWILYFDNGLEWSLAGRREQFPKNGLRVGTHTHDLSRSARLYTTTGAPPICMAILLGPSFDSMALACQSLVNCFQSSIRHLVPFSTRWARLFSPVVTFSTLPLLTWDMPPLTLVEMTIRQLSKFLTIVFPH